MCVGCVVWGVWVWVWVVCVVGGLGGSGWGGDGSVWLRVGGVGGGWGVVGGDGWVDGAGAVEKKKSAWLCGKWMWVGV